MALSTLVNKIIGIYSESKDCPTIDDPFNLPRTNVKQVLTNKLTIKSSEDKVSTTLTQLKDYSFEQ